ncbi:hypothetical protein PpBr36_08109 [Pyricularia pennisetigena]|uniref:hypothetical protein n=1 Tax=Pyricularia pennisetigena TaxID=1578925 RepID=UPI00114DA8BF|nr:hypothetical protein PpBr36_08109 [Pyricularia pennisetigena]TLS24636.1 hypothetical protein PpBr36_08109 [Pyricularia pennisetigena]
MPPSTEPFPFPREYHFPPFFTRQTNLTTHHAQLTKWSALVLAYCRHHRIFKLPLTTAAAVSAAASSSSSTDPQQSQAPSSSPATDDLFHNKALNRRLSPADVREVIDFMCKEGRAEYCSSGGGGSTAAAAAAGGDVAWIFWRSPEEWAQLIEGWVDETAQKGSVLTLYELVEGDGTLGTDIHGIDRDMLHRALQVLVKRGKAQIFGQEDSQGVKFF